jgi:uncharacterized protein YyaL (SSP411 family)
VRAPRGALLLLGAAAILLLPAPAARAQAPGDREGIRSGPRTKRDHEIRWQEWGPAAFDQARREGKLVLLDLTAVWCHWCHVMDETTYSDPEVIQALNSQFVAIRVDADRNPQVTDRYLVSGWPTTAVLTPEGQVLASQTYVPPAEFRRMLVEIQDFYRKNRRAVQEKVAEQNRAVDATWKSEPPDTAGSATLEAQIGRTLDALREGEDKKHGGFGSSPKFHNADAVAFLFREARQRRDPGIRAVAVRAVDGAMRLEDSVWGGYFRYATKADWSAPHFEKLLSGNAEMLGSLVLAYGETGARRYRDAARRTVEYLDTWLRGRSGARGGWFGSQDADVGSHDPAAKFCAGEEYYVLGDRPRRQVGIPHVDSTIYAGANARLVSALAEGVRAGVFVAPGFLDPARSALDRIWSEGRAPDGSLYHAITRRGGVSPDLLEDQALAGLACLDLYETAGDTTLLDRARALRDWIRAHLEDRVGGGFRYGLPDSDAVGRTRAGERSEGGSVLAATLFLRLYWQDGNPEDRASVDRTLAWLRSGKTVVLDPARALLAERAAASPVRIAVIGDPDKESTRALRGAAYRADAPAVVTRVFGKGGPEAHWGEVSFPAKPSPALYLCGPRACSPPITNPDVVARKVREFLAAGLH